MSVAGQIRLTLDGRKLVLASAIGPSAAVSVSPDTYATVTLTLQNTTIKPHEVLGVLQINGVQSATGLVLAGYTVSGFNVNVIVYNPTTSTPSIAANSITAVVLLEGW